MLEGHVDAKEEVAGGRSVVAHDRHLVLARVTVDADSRVLVGKRVGLRIESALIVERREEHERVLNRCVEAQAADAEVLDGLQVGEVVTESDGTHLEIAGIEVTEG